MSTVASSTRPCRASASSSQIEHATNAPSSPGLRRGYACLAGARKPSPCRAARFPWPGRWPTPSRRSAGQQPRTGCSSTSKYARTTCGPGGDPGLRVIARDGPRPTGAHSYTLVFCAGRSSLAYPNRHTFVTVPSDTPPSEILDGVLSGIRGDSQASRTVISARALEKRYGRKRALRPVDFELGQGSFLLVTGPNGSGKTTLLRLIAGLAAPSKGALDVGVERGRLGYLGHKALLYRDLTALENLDLFGRLYRVTERRERIGVLLDRFGLWPVRSERAGSFSRGMLQRLALCRTLLHDPDLLVLDEPFTALDAEGSALLDRQLSDLAENSTVVLSTHDPARVEHLSTDRIALV
jgi:heme exporter protein A